MPIFPLTSAPLRRANDVEAEARMRLLLLRAVREGSVPDMAVVDAATNADYSENEASEALLSMVINDLGAETDERLEQTEGNELYEAITSSEESPEEEDLISDAMAFIDIYESNRNASLQLYQREFQREKLITAEEEVVIAKDMERAITQAIDVLATWPQGIVHVIACSELVKSGEKPIQWFSGGARDDEMSQIDSAETFVGIPEMNEPDVDSTADQKEQPAETDSVDLFVSSYCEYETFLERRCQSGKGFSLRRIGIVFFKAGQGSCWCYSSKLSCFLCCHAVRPRTFKKILTCRWRYRF